MKFTLKEILRVVNGSLYNEMNKDLIIYDFEYSNKELAANSKKGLCFISISNERWSEFHRRDLRWKDGNESALMYVNNIDLLITERSIKSLKYKLPQIIVKNSLQAIILLAEAARKKMKNNIIAITGSVGKSSTRLFFEHLISNDKFVIATRGNHNTQMGVPLYGAKLCTNPDLAFIEISLNALNNRGNQSEVIQPHVAVVTSIGEAHLSTLDTTENVALYKSRIFKGLVKNGLAIINGDIDELELKILIKEAKKRTNNIKFYSTKSSGSDIYLEKITDYKKYSLVQVVYRGYKFSYKLKLPSLGIVSNSLAVFLTLLELGYDITPYLNKTANFRSLDKVLELKTIITKDKRKIDIIDDTHNAAIPSMINAIDTFNKKTTFYKGKKILVLGQVADLGDRSEELHERLYEHILKSKADYVFGHGEHMRKVIQKLPNKLVGGWFVNSATMAKTIPMFCSEDSLVLLKGSVSGSDYRLISNYLPSSLQRSDKVLKRTSSNELSNVIQKIPCLQVFTTNNKLLKSYGYKSTESVEGLGVILLIYLLFEKGINIEREAPLNQWITNKGSSIYSKHWKKGVLYSDGELFEELILTQHPSAVYELAYRYFGSRVKAMSNIDKLLNHLDLKKECALNLTGRYRKKEQQRYKVDDMRKVSVKLMRYKDKLPVIYQDKNIILKGIVYGRLKKSMIAYVSDGRFILANGFKENELLGALKYIKII